jgi:hypothetical protein
MRCSQICSPTPEKRGARRVNVHRRGWDVELELALSASMEQPGNRSGPSSKRLLGQLPGRGWVRLPCTSATSLLNSNSISDWGPTRRKSPANGPRRLPKRFQNAFAAHFCSHFRSGGACDSMGRETSPAVQMRRDVPQTAHYARRRAAETRVRRFLPTDVLDEPGEVRLDLLERFDSRAGTPPPASAS